MSSLALAQGTDVCQCMDRTADTRMHHAVVLGVASEIGDDAFEIAVSGGASLGWQRRPVDRVFGCSLQPAIPSIGLVTAEEADLPEGGKRMARKAKRGVWW